MHYHTKMMHSISKSLRQPLEEPPNHDWPLSEDQQGTNAIGIMLLPKYANLALIPISEQDFKGDNRW